jgi:hypothetical protein
MFDIPNRLHSIYVELVRDARNRDVGLVPADARTSYVARRERGRRYRNLEKLCSLGLAVVRASGPRGGKRYHVPKTPGEIARCAELVAKRCPDFEPSAVVDALVQISNAGEISAHARLQAIEFATRGRARGITISR